MNGDGVPSWAKGIAWIIAAATGLVIALAAAGVLDGNDTPTVTETKKVPVLDGVTLDADNQKEPAEMVESGAKPAPLDGDNPVAAPNIANAGPDIHEDARDEVVPGITREEANDALVTPPGVGPRQPVGGAQSFQCDRHIVRNQSFRAAGVRQSMEILHITVSAPGSINGIFNLFNTSASGASAHIGIELNGECQQWVDWVKKAWTEGAFNSSGESWEIVTNLLTRNEWLAAPIIRDAILARQVAERLKANGLPPRLVDPKGCTPIAGVTDHERLECGNNHVDVGSGFPWDKFMEDVRQLYKHGSIAPPCDAKCERVERQKKVVAGRDRKHAETHAAIRQLRFPGGGRCRTRIHSHPPAEFRRDECRKLKRRDVRQRRGEHRARVRLSKLRAA